MGYEEYFYSDSYCFVEWPERIASLLSADFANLYMEEKDGIIIKMKYMTNLSSIRKRRIFASGRDVEVKNKQSKLSSSGYPKKKHTRKMIALVPEAVQLLVDRGHEVWVEAGAGDSANFSDNEYSEHGAKIVYISKRIISGKYYSKVEPPTLEEVDLMKGQTLISALQIPTKNKAYFQYLLEKKVTALAYEFIQDESGMMHSYAIDE